MLTSRKGKIFGSTPWNLYSGCPWRWYTNASSGMFFNRKLQPSIRQLISSSLSTLQFIIKLCDKFYFIFFTNSPCGCPRGSKLNQNCTCTTRPWGQQHGTINRSLWYLVTEEIEEQNIVYGQTDSWTTDKRVWHKLDWSLTSRANKCNTLHPNISLWPWPLTTKINSFHSHIMVNKSSKFDEDAHDYYSSTNWPNFNLIIQIFSTYRVCLC